MLINNIIIIKWNKKNKDWYESKGYIFTKYGDKFKIEAKNLINGSTIEVEVNYDCECCKHNHTKIMRYIDYERRLRDCKYYCNAYASKLFGSETRRKSRLLNGQSFEQWCIDSNRQNVLDRWDYELNDCVPSEILYSTHKKYYFKCLKGLHPSELKSINNFTSGQEGSIKCIGCNSIAQWGIDNICEDFLERYWDYEKNILNPWEVKHGGDTKIWIKCQEKEYHDSYKISCFDFTKGNRCPYCSNRNGKFHILDSLGTLYPQVLDIWSDKNEKTAFKYTPKTEQKVWWKCENSKHEDYYRIIKDAHKCGFRCPECGFSKGEKRIEEYLKLNNLVYIPQKEFDGLLGLGNRQLSYDFYLPKYNILIEYQGEQHEKYIKGFHKSKKDFERQQEHDRRKKEYAENNKIELLPIWYWDYDNIEEILKNEIKKENNIG